MVMQESGVIGAMPSGRFPFLNVKMRLNLRHKKGAVNIKKFVLSIDLSPGLNMLIETALRSQNAELIVCQSAREIKRALSISWYCLIAVDASGWTETEQMKAAARIRDTTPAPLLFIAAPGYTVGLLKAGADLCLPPDTIEENIVSHAMALIRRYVLYNHYDVKNPDTTILYRGDLVIDPMRCRVTHAGKPLHLQRRELRLLIYFAQNPDIVLTPEQICETVWMTEHDYNRDVSAVIAELRRKLSDNKEHPTYIETVRGIGYRFLPIT